MDINPLENKYCKFLKAKSPYGLTEGGENPWFLLDEANTICWCIKSAGGAGPDNGLVAPAKCVKGRSCFMPAVE
ncbi:MAG: hypothetical protein HKN87_12970 [Saprospiraceae bacterium]|nr:hypothetical protein [Saprospiraceae bacterium]